MGWILELFFRRIVHGKWINPGFLIGPYLPIYGFGLVALTVIYLLFKDSNLNPIIVILLMGLFMTLIELIGGLMVLRNNIRLWDYSNRWGNYKGVICPLFSAIWTAVGGVYYFFLAPYVIHALEWFSENLVFSYTLGLFSGFIIIDYCYSNKLYSKIKQYANENNITVLTYSITDKSANLFADNIEINTDVFGGCINLRKVKKMCLKSFYVIGIVLW